MIKVFYLFSLLHSSNLNKSADYRCSLGLFVDSLSKAELDLAKSLNYIHLHLLFEPSLHHALMQISDDVVESERLLRLNLAKSRQCCLEVFHRKCPVYLLDILRRRSSSYFVDFLDRDIFISQTTTLKNVHNFAHVAFA